MADFIDRSLNLETFLKKASNVYEDYIKNMLIIVSEIQSLRKARCLIPARKIWELGDLIFKLTGKMETLSLQIDGLYDHLVRDLHAKRKWLEKVIVLRRYLPRKTLIPKELNWGQCEKGTRKVAEKLLKKAKKQ